ncbi:hypothetical protein TPB0596_38370 [Tsukamurella pulmonis]|nr:hypothetical protein TPB0596_38370 [Tsukamurella pulmonis]
MQPVAHPPSLPRCELCGGTQVGNLSVPGAWLNPNGRTARVTTLSRLAAVVCLQCGNTTLFATDLDKVRREAQAHPERFTW